VLSATTVSSSVDRARDERGTIECARDMSEPSSPLEAPVADETAAAPVVALAAGETVEDSIVRWTKALKVKDKQIVLVSTQNEQLRSSMGMLETELQELSKTLLAKESQLHLKEREIEKRDDEIRRLTALEQQENGKERAIEIASTQNGQLLSLLEVHEGKTKLLTEERDKLTEELKDLKIMHAAQMRRDGATDAKLRVELSESQDAFNHLSLEHQDLTMRHNGFEELVRNTERDARAAVQTIQEELADRRDKAYSMLQRLQGSEDELRKSQYACEQFRSEQEALRQRSDELEERLSSLLVQLHEKDGEIEELRLKLSESYAKFQTEHDRNEAAKHLLQGQVDELSRSLLRVVAQQKETQSSLAARDTEIGALQARLKEAKIGQEKRQREVAEQVRSTDKVDAEKEALVVEVARLKNDIEALHAELDSIPRPAKTLQAADAQEIARLEAIRLHLGLARVLSRDAVPLKNGSNGGGGEGSGSSGPSSLSDGPTSFVLPGATIATLKLSRCAIEEKDLSMIVDRCKECTFLERIDLSSNFLTDRCVSLLSSMLTFPGSKVRLLEIRNNNISIDGIRALALDLESTAVRGIKHVYIHRDGQIEAIGAVSTNAMGASDDEIARPVNPSTVVRIDARENCVSVPTDSGDPNVMPQSTFPTPGSSEKMNRAATLNATRKRIRRPVKRTNQYSLRSDILRDVSALQSLFFRNPASDKLYSAHFFL
jgi:hypothetical protein